MFRTNIDNIFDEFQQTKYWARLPNLQKGLMLNMYDQAKESESIAKEFADFLEKMMKQKPKLDLRLRK